MSAVRIQSLAQFRRNMILLLTVLKGKNKEKRPGRPTSRQSFEEKEFI